jgi:hypothetical protein
MGAGYPQLQPVSPQMQARNRIAMQLMGQPQGGVRPATMLRQPVNPMRLAAQPQSQLQQQMQPYGEALGNYFKSGTV